MAKISDGLLRLHDRCAGIYEVWLIAYGNQPCRWRVEGRQPSCAKFEVLCKGWSFIPKVCCLKQVVLTQEHSPYFPLCSSSGPASNGRLRLAKLSPPQHGHAGTLGKSRGVLKQRFSALSALYSWSGRVLTYALTYLPT